MPIGTLISRNAGELEERELKAALRVIFPDDTHPIGAIWTVQ